MTDNNAFTGRQRQAVERMDRRVADLEKNALSVRNDYVLAREVVEGGGNAGTFAAKTWQPRGLNDLTDPSAIAYLNGSVLVVPAGKYLVSGSAPAIEAGQHKVRLFDATLGRVLLWGSSEDATLADHSSRSVLSGWIQLAGKTSLQLQHWGEATKEGDGQGRGDGQPYPAVFAMLELTRIG